MDRFPQSWCSNTRIIAISLTCLTSRCGLFYPIPCIASLSIYLSLPRVGSRCCQRNFFGHMYPYPAEVKYRDINQKPDYFKDLPSWNDLLATKAKEWEHEQEVRLITKEPLWIHAGRDIPKELYNEELVDGKEIRHYPPLSSDCFESVYLGVNIFHQDRDKIIKAAKDLNPEIKIYQMTTDPEAFKLKEKEIEEI